MSPHADIARLVAAHVPLDDHDSHAMACSMLDEHRPMWPRDEFDPGHFTASGFVASPDQSSILLVDHGRLARWLQPGGHFEHGDESVAGAARREVVEETGVSDLDVIPGGVLRIDAHPIPPNATEPRHTHVDLAIGFTAGSWAIGPVAEVLDARWVAFDDLGSYGVDEAVLAGVASLSRRLGSIG